MYSFYRRQIVGHRVDKDIKITTRINFISDPLPFRLMVLDLILTVLYKQIINKKRKVNWFWLIISYVTNIKKPTNADLSSKFKILYVHTPSMYQTDVIN